MMSSSGSCSSRRRSPFSSFLRSYKLISSSYPVEFDYEGEDVFCYCNMKAPRWTSWTDENPGRRFYGCQQYPGENVCGFHSWHDAKFPSRAREIIINLKNREMFLLNETKLLKSEVTELRERALDEVEEGILEENLKLKNKLSTLKGTLNCRSNGKRWKITTFVFLCVILFLVFFRPKNQCNSCLIKALPK